MSTNRFYKAGSVCMMLLGIVHTIYFLFSVMLEEGVVHETLANTIKRGAVWFVGERSLLIYYSGYSLSMGLLLISYGLLALMTNRTTKTQILCLAVSAVAFVICVVCFHLLAYSLMGLSTLFYLCSLSIEDA
ncbi:MAG: hypothetical protein LBH80_04935 [Prevotellaceae bacterium]|jgi:hypothetical protein|nr:hypothetical protein [Prevotellaceae bacterium]